MSQKKPASDAAGTPGEAGARVDSPVLRVLTAAILGICAVAIAIFGDFGPSIAAAAIVFMLANVAQGRRLDEGLSELLVQARAAGHVLYAVRTAVTGGNATAGDAKPPPEPQ